MAQVLIIDNDDVARNGLRRLLQTAGHEVAKAVGGPQVMGRFGQAVPYRLDDA